MCKIALVDQHDLFRQSLQCLIHLNSNNKVVLSSTSLNLIKCDLERGMADVLLVDIENLSDQDWVSLVEISTAFSAIKIVVLSNEMNSKYFEKIMRCRIQGYYSKRIAHTELLEAVDQISNSNGNFDLKLGPIVREAFFKTTFNGNIEIDDSSFSLSTRELQVLNLICTDLSNDEISDVLKVSVRTVETYRSRIIKKTKSKSIVGAIMYAIDKKLIKK